MKINVVPRLFVEKQIDVNPNWYCGKWIISIFSAGSCSPLSVDRYNILKLEFDDVSERDMGGWNSIFDDSQLIFFNQEHAKKIHEFIDSIPENDEKPFIVHCDAGVSRSGAVGYILNEYFNKYLKDDKDDYDYFLNNNNHIMPNPLVVRLLKLELFGKPFQNIEVNDYSYNEDGDKIDNIERI